MGKDEIESETIVPKQYCGSSQTEQPADTPPGQDIVLSQTSTSRVMPS